jgi:DNA-binding NarL/FixJ family response regulator
VIADNDPAALELVLMDLRLEGHVIVGSATDGDTALQLCRDLRPDCLVVDYRMPPGPTGVEVARSVRSELPSVNVVVFSNYSTAEVRRAVARAGARFVEKGDLSGLRAALAG